MQSGLETVNANGARSTGHGMPARAMTITSRETHLFSTMATSDKYDRQLRLWGSNGQRRLSETTVFLVQATAVGCEVLKNLVLPGVGGFVVVDGASPPAGVDDADANFFVPSSAVDGQRSRAQIATEHLRELNEDVKGEYRDVPDLLQVDYDQLFQANTGTGSVLVVASDLEPPVLDLVARACDRNRIPLVVVQSYGLIGSVRLQTPPLPLVNPKPRDTVPDLRLAAPFPSLQQLADSIDLSALENHQHGHVPYPILLLKVMEDWRKGQAHQPHSEEGGPKRLPAAFAEKQEFQRMVRDAARDYDSELNFQEAVQNAYLAYTGREVDRQHLAQLRDAAAESSSTASGPSPSQSSASESCRSFHAMVLGLEQFCDKHGRAPIQGTIPDMTSSTDLYVSLQNLYRAQALEDLEELRRLVASSGASTGVAVDDDDLLTFCQNVFDLDLLRTRTLHEEWDPATPAPQEICDDLASATLEGDEREDQIPLLWGLGLGACRLFYQEAGRYPGVLDDWESDVDALQACIARIVGKYSLQDNELVQKTLLRGTDYAAELARYGNAEVHNIASLIGGVASQEAVKIITGQYIPLDNTYVYNGIASTGGVYRF